MKTKTLFKPLAIVIIAVIGMNKTYAQVTPVTLGTGTANLTVELVSFGSIAVTNATITYDDATDFTSANTATATATVSSLLPYTVSVAATTSGTSTLSDGNSNTIPLSIVTVTAPTANGITTKGSNIAISTTNTGNDIFSSATGAINATEDIIYSISSTDAIANLISKPAGNYSISLTYTISTP